MIDHATVRESLATSFDFSLDASEADALEEHLRHCPACSSFEASLRTDAAMLRGLDFGPVPVAIRANVAIAAEVRGRNAARRRIGLVAVAALLLVALGSAMFGGGSAPKEVVGGSPVHWLTNVVELQASDFWIDANGQRFTATGAQVSVHSDPGDATYRTLEVEWMEHGVEMRLNLYFGGDATTSWVKEIRIYDGKVDGDWLTATGRFAEAPLRAIWAGDLDIEFGGGPARLHLGGARIRSTPFDGVTEPAGGGINLPEDAQPFAPGGALHCSGILQMTPKQAEVALLRLGYRLSWRLDETSGPGGGFSRVIARAPDGVIHEAGLPGSGGELIMFVAPVGDPGAVPIPFPADCPRIDPNATPSPAP
jgi:hypothetical protein